jgi:hypothetical protein
VLITIALNSLKIPDTKHASKRRNNKNNIFFLSYFLIMLMLSFKEIIRKKTRRYNIKPSEDESIFRLK